MLGRWLAIASIGVLSGTVAVATAEANDKVTITYNVAVGASYPLYVGLEQGFFAKAGIDLNLMRAGSPTAINAAVLSGDADIGIAATNGGFFNSAANGDLRLIAAGDLVRKGFAAGQIIAGTASYEKGLKSAGDLGGKRVGVNAPGTFSDLNMLRLSDKYHFPFDRNLLVPLGSDANAAAAVKAGSIDAMFAASASLIDTMVTSGDGKVIAKLSEETPGIGTLLYVNTKVLASRREVLVKFLRGYLATARFYSEALEKRDDNGNFVPTADSDRLIAVIAKNANVAAGSVPAGITYLPPDARFDPADVTGQIAGWERLGLVDHKVDTAAGSLVDFSLLDEASHH